MNTRIFSVPPDCPVACAEDFVDCWAQPTAISNSAELSSARFLILTATSFQAPILAGNEP
jgi:hypothetical protein